MIWWFHCGWNYECYEWTKHHKKKVNGNKIREKTYCSGVLGFYDAF